MLKNKDFNSDNFRHQNSFDYNSFHNSNNFFDPNQFPVQSSSPQNYSNFRIPSHLKQKMLVLSDLYISLTIFKIKFLFKLYHI